MFVGTQSKLMFSNVLFCPINRIHFFISLDVTTGEKIVRIFKKVTDFVCCFYDVVSIVISLFQLFNVILTFHLT